MQSRSVYRKKHNSYKALIVIIVSLIAIVTLIFFLSRPQTTRLKFGELTQSEQWEAIVIFNEVLIELPDNERIIFAVSNNKLVQAEQEIGKYYKKGYLTSAFETYSELQEKIVQYQNDVLLKDIYQHELNQYSIEISTVLTELQSFDSVENDYIELNEKLNTLLQNRQFFIRDNYPADEFLQTLYEEESLRLTALNDWIEPIKAVSNGYVSWYVNSSYRNINTSTAAELTVSDIHLLLDKDGSIYKNVNNSIDFGVRIIADGYVYFAITVDNNTQFNGQTVLYTNISDAPLNCSVVTEKTESGEKSVILKAECNVSEFLEHRYIKLSATPFTKGYLIDKNFVLNDGTGDYVLIQNANNEKTPVFVDVLAVNDNIAVISSQEQSIITQDTQIFSK